MDRWLKKLNDNGTKPTPDDVETAVKTNVTLKRNSKKWKFSEKNEASHTKKRLRKKRLVIPKKDRLMIVFCSMVLFLSRKTVSIVHFI